jgi:hypothetical protein
VGSEQLAKDLDQAMYSFINWETYRLLSLLKSHKLASFRWALIFLQLSLQELILKLEVLDLRLKAGLVSHVVEHLVLVVCDCLGHA